MASLKELVEAKTRLIAEREERKRAHEKAEARALHDLAEIQTAMTAARNGIPPEQFEVAKTVLNVSGSCESGDDIAAVAAAMREIAAGGGNLRIVYLGSKNYDHWHHQGIECGYGYIPSHGSVVFRIGLTDEARKRELTPAEIEAALAVLNAVTSGFRMDGKAA